MADLTVTNFIAVAEEILLTPVVVGEEWRDIPGYEGFYQVSNIGRVRSLNRISAKGARIKGRILCPGNDGSREYEIYMLWKDAKPKTYGAHVLVALAFIGPRPSLKHQVNHIDGNKRNNQPDNLEWVTPKENIRHAIEVLGYDFRNYGAANGRAKLTEEQVRYARQHHQPGKHGSIARLAHELGVSYQTLWAALSGRSWNQPENEQPREESTGDDRQRGN